MNPMNTKAIPGQLVALRDAAEVARESATRMARALIQAIARSGRATLALSGGDSPLDAYTQLAKEPGVDWTKVNVFWVDERAVPPTDERSNYRWAKATLVDGAGISPERVHRMPGEAADLDAAARDYEKLVRAHVAPDADGVPAFDVMVLGIGDDGHTASLFPGNQEIHVQDRLVLAVAPHAGLEARLTLTSPAIEHARHVFIIVIGPGKRPALERAWAAQGNIDETPMRVVRGCRGAVTWLIDREAGAVGE
jgi:6-phosphogluconolactonase